MHRLTIVTNFHIPPGEAHPEDSQDMVELPSELWCEIFSHLSVIPPASSDPSLQKWKDYAQPDLCMVMRVCSVSATPRLLMRDLYAYGVWYGLWLMADVQIFHLTAGTILYSHAAVVDLRCFLHGLDHTPPHRRPKKDLLGCVTDLRLINPSPAITEQVVLRMSFLGWGPLVQTDKALIEDSTETILKPITSLIFTLNAHHEALLPRLKRLSVSSMNEFLWIMLESAQSTTKIQQDLGVVRQVLPLLLRGTTIEWHQYVKHGPYSLTRGTLVDPPADTRGSVVHHVDQLLCQPPFWINGWENVILTDWKCAGMKDAMEIIEGHLEAMDEESRTKKMEASTRLKYVFAPIGADATEGGNVERGIGEETDVECWLPMDWKGKVSVAFSRD